MAGLGADLKLALGSWAFSFGPFEEDPWEFERVCCFTAQAGYDGVEINGFRPHPHHRDYVTPELTVTLRAMMRDAGVVPAAYAPDFASVPPAEVPQAAYVSEIDAARSFCERMDIGLLRVDTVTAPGTVDPEVYERRFDALVATWATSAERCARSGVTLVWEFEPGFWLNRPSEVVRVVQAVNHPNFRLLFDSSHAYTGAVAGARQGPEPEILEGGEVEYARRLAPYVGHLHLIDSDGSLHGDETSEHLPFGAGNVDFPGLLRALEPTLDSLEWWGVDFCFCPTTEVDAPTAVPFVRSLAESLKAPVR